MGNSIFLQTVNSSVNRISKKCYKCEKIKQLIYFNKKKCNKDGFDNICKECKKKENEIYRKENQKYFNNYLKNYRFNNPNYMKNWYDKNKNEFNEKVNKKKRNNRDIIRDKERIYRKNNREQFNKRCREYNKKRKKIDPDFKLRVLLRHRLYLAIKKDCKKTSAINLLGCSILFLKKYLELLFQYGMTWKNHGEWHIDHIKPCASFDLTKESEQKKCFHYTNLQPLWAKDNLTKGASSWPVDTR